jgi:hypothetical protein
MNRSPHQARMGKKLRGKPGDMHQVQLILWHALKRAQGVLDTAVEDDETLKACHAVGQLAGQYVKLLEVGELEARLTALEQALEGMRR